LKRKCVSISPPGYFYPREEWARQFDSNCCQNYEFWQLQIKGDSVVQFLKRTFRGLKLAIRHFGQKLSLRTLWRVVLYSTKCWGRVLRKSGFLRFKNGPKAELMQRAL
jgi:hypothetical protein